MSLPQKGDHIKITGNSTSHEFKIGEIFPIIDVFVKEGAVIKSKIGITWVIEPQDFIIISKEEFLNTLLGYQHSLIDIAKIHYQSYHEIGLDDPEHMEKSILYAYQKTLDQEDIRIENFKFSDDGSGECSFDVFFRPPERTLKIQMGKKDEQ